MSRYINRDCFARTTLMRDTERANGSTCSWCGNVRKGNRLYRYRVENDGGRDHSDNRLFCSLDCRNTFYGG